MHGYLFCAHGRDTEIGKYQYVVSMEVTASALPDAWAVFCGFSDVIAFLEGLPVTVDALPEGTISLNTNRN